MITRVRHASSSLPHDRDSLPSVFGPMGWIGPKRLVTALGPVP
jgi:hypothetical protein